MKYIFTITKEIDDEEYNITEKIGDNVLTSELIDEIFEDLLDINTCFDNVSITIKPVQEYLSSDEFIIDNLNRRIEFLMSQLNDSHKVK